MQLNSVVRYVIAFCGNSMRTFLSIKSNPGALLLSSCLTVQITSLGVTAFSGNSSWWSPRISAISASSESGFGSFGRKTLDKYNANGSAFSCLDLAQMFPCSRRGGYGFLVGYFCRLSRAHSPLRLWE